MNETTIEQRVSELKDGLQDTLSRHGAYTEQLEDSVVTLLHKFLVAEVDIMEERFKAELSEQAEQDKKTIEALQRMLHLSGSKQKAIIMIGDGDNQLEIGCYSSTDQGPVPQLATMTMKAIQIITQQLFGNGEVVRKTLGEAGEYEIFHNLEEMMKGPH